jgi:hypothetical protein
MNRICYIVIILKRLILFLVCHVRGCYKEHQGKSPYLRIKCHLFIEVFKFVGTDEYIQIIFVIGHR